MVSSKEMLVKREVISKLAIDTLSMFKSKECSSWRKENESLMEYWLVEKG